MPRHTTPAIAKADAQIQNILGPKPTSRELGDLLSDLETMSDETACFIYGTTAAKDALYARVFDRYQDSRSALKGLR